MNIPVVLKNLGKKASSSTSCTRNAIITNIAQRIPIPRPLTKINGQITSHFEGTIADQQNQFTSPSPNSNPRNSSTLIPLSNNQPQTVTTVDSQGQLTVNVIPSVTTVVETATISASSRSKPTKLDGSHFGGPGGDLTNVSNGNAELLQSSSCVAVAGYASKKLYQTIAALCIFLYIMI